MPKIIILIGYIWNSTLFWQRINCYELSSCHQKILMLQINWGITNITVYQKLVWWVESEILPYCDRLSVVTSCQTVIKKFDSRNCLGNSKSNCMPKISLIGGVWNFALFWHLISCHELSSCPKKIWLQKLFKGLWI